MIEDHCTGERCTCNATGCPYVCSGPTIESTWPNEARMNFERLRESFAIVRTRGGVAGYQPVRVHYSYEGLRALLAERKRPTWANARRARLANATPQDRRPPYPWARCAL